jgi:ubiquinone/menaquinone biosynthesis C-methylase UbiE
MASNNPSFTAAPAAFDRIAEQYDAIFTDTTVGKAQRHMVWDALARAFSQGDSVLELNCGTGEDAFHLAGRGIAVTACDASSAMIEVARRRCEKAVNAKVEFRLLANEDLQQIHGDRIFDGAFSNFSGLNCTEDMYEVAVNLSRLLRPGSRLLICLWTRACFWEILWYLGRANLAKAFRRVRGMTIACVEGFPVSVWYPTFRQVRQTFGPWFRVRSIRAVGLVVPPSYVEPWARRHPGWIAALAKVDRVLGRLPVLRGVGDHVLWEFERIPS